VAPVEADAVAHRRIGGIVVLAIQDQLAGDAADVGIVEVGNQVQDCVG
jgi:hypothetical protein